MYCDKESVNILTAALAAYGVRHVVLCPGARSSVIAHNIATCDAFVCHAVTDERSAGFVAVGMAQSSAAPVAVCVTSGSAVLNLAPAVAEAYYRRLPLVIISADRPNERIGQNDGQTLPQIGVLRRFCRKSINIPEVTDDVSRRWCERMLHDTLQATDAFINGDSVRPIHINVPISEPLFSFTTKSLPSVSAIKSYSRTAVSAIDNIICQICDARCPVWIIGQAQPGYEAMIKGIDATGSILILSEVISNATGAMRMASLESGMVTLPDDVDLVIYSGDMFIGKAVKKALRANSKKRVVRVGEDDEFIDTFYNTTHVLPMSHREFAMHMSNRVCDLHFNHRVADIAKEFDSAYREDIFDCVSEWSDKAAFGIVSKALSQVPHGRVNIHLANSMSVRNGAIFLASLELPTYCNRGVNGIEGTLSAAVGFSAINTDVNICFIGDLSFFYDRNALWNELPKQGLIIILFNNDGGQIHRGLPGLSSSPHLPRYIVAEHSTTAKHMAAESGLLYFAASDAHELKDISERLLRDCTPDTQPILIEVFTGKEHDRVKKQ